jgi:predicted alpha/beta hydrolase
MPNYAGLTTALATFAAGTTDDAIISAINAQTVTVPIAVPTSSLAAYLATNGFTVALQAYAGVDGGAPPSGASTLSIQAAKMVMLLISASPAVPTMDFTNAAVVAEVTACLAAFVAEGTAGRLLSIAGVPFGATHQAAILAIGSTTTSQAAQLGFPNGITENDLIVARQ